MSTGRGRRLGLGSVAIAGPLAVVALFACSPKVRLATDEPIVLNLNVRVEQEVRIKLDKEVEELIGTEQAAARGVVPRGIEPPLSTEDARAVSQAKRTGRAGERADGYLGIASPEAGAEIQALTERVNEGRREAYARLADAYDASPSDVQAIAGARRIEEAEPGEPVRTPDGRWITR